LWNFNEEFISQYAAIVSRITNLLKGTNPNIEWCKPHEAAFLMITIDLIMEDFLYYVILILINLL